MFGTKIIELIDLVFYHDGVITNRIEVADSDREIENIGELWEIVESSQRRVGQVAEAVILTSEGLYFTARIQD